MPLALKPIFGDGIILTSLAAVSLNIFFNTKSASQAQDDAVPTAGKVPFVAPPHVGAE